MTDKDKLIRCKDCAKYHHYNDPISDTHWCNQWCRYVIPEGYCYKAVPRTYRADWVQEDDSEEWTVTRK